MHIFVGSTACRVHSFNGDEAQKTVQVVLSVTTGLFKRMLHGKGGDTVSIPYFLPDQRPARGMMDGPANDGWIVLKQCEIKKVTLRMTAGDRIEATIDFGYKSSKIELGHDLRDIYPKPERVMSWDDLYGALERFSNCR